MSRTLLHLLFAFGCLSLLATGVVFGNVRRAARQSLEAPQVRIDDESDNFFINAHDVQQLLTRNGVEPLQGRPTAGIQLGALEQRLRANPYVRDAEVWRDLRGGLRVRVRQNRPVARLIHDDAGQDVYIDADGRRLPLSTRYTARVLPISFTDPTAEFAPTFFQDSVGRAYLALVQHLSADPFWRAQVAQVSILPNGKVVLWPQVGDQLIEFGYPDRTREKLTKLLAFYQHGLPAVGWDAYRRVNVEYRNQIVCQ